MRTLALVLALTAFASPASAQEASTDADRAGLAVFTAIVASSATWVTTTPWIGYWRDSPRPHDWRAWVSALVVGAAAGLTTFYAAPETQEAVLVQAYVLAGAVGLEVGVLMFRGLLALGTDICNQLCHKLVVALPLVLGLAASFVAGQLVDDEAGPPMMTSMPLTMEF